MKTIKLLVAIITALAIFQSVNAQSDKSQRTIGIKTAAIKVFGECNMCKKKIERAAFSAEGIKSAVWDEDSKQLTIKYDSFKKNAVDDVQKKIASVGYDTEKYLAGDKVYEKLPECCRYERKKETLKDKSE